MPARLRHAWKVIATVDVGIVVYGLMAAWNPSVLTAGFETYTGTVWAEFAAREELAADFIVHGFRLLGIFNVAIGLTLVIVAATAFRHAQWWSWSVLLIGNTLAFGGPIVYDQVVGAIGVFEILEYVGLFAVYAALAATAPLLRDQPVALP